MNLKVLKPEIWEKAQRPGPMIPRAFPTPTSKPPSGRWLSRRMIVHAATSVNDDMHLGVKRLFGWPLIVLTPSIFPIANPLS